MTDVLKKSICLDDYLEAKETIVSGKVWVNRNFLDGYPMYMNGIHKDGELVMLIFIQEVGNEQLSLYYLNLFQILCGLVETALCAHWNIRRQSRTGSTCRVHVY